MQLTFKAIARSAGYYAYSHHSSSGKLQWTWRESVPYGTESASTLFDTEDLAYRDCCIKAGLVKTTSAGDILS